MACCSEAAQCSEGEGDCDTHTQCAGDLVCVEDNCRLWNPLAAADFDCCQGKVNTILVKFLKTKLGIEP